MDSLRLIPRVTCFILLAFLGEAELSASGQSSKEFGHPVEEHVEPEPFASVEDELEQVFGITGADEFASDLQTTGFRQDPAPLMPQQQLRPGQIDQLPGPSLLAPSDFASRLRTQRRLAAYTARQRAAPSILGDTQDGACGSANIGGLPGNGFSHPTFNCVRANIAENNSPMPRDRVYFRYNHFANITKIDFSAPFGGNSELDLNIERMTFGWEATFFEGRFSLETRIPIARQLTSHLELLIFENDRKSDFENLDWELLNVSMLGKLLVHKTDNFLASVGLGLNTPTGEGLYFRNLIDDPAFYALPGVPVPLHYDFSANFRNEIFNLSPFAAALWTPNDRWFAQGFLQLDIPLNTSDVVYRGFTEGQGVVVRTPETRLTIRQQTLFRANMAAGFWVFRKPERRFLTGWALAGELHYTTTLNDTSKAVAPLPFFIPPEPFPPVPVTATVIAGNLANRIDIVNMTLGSTFAFGEKTTLATGFVLPLREGANKPFDFEFTAQLNYLY